MWRSGRFFARATFLCVVLAGCRGAGSSTSSPSVPTSTGPAYGTAAFTMAVPRSDGAATPQSISITLTQVNGALPAGKVISASFNFTATTTGCTRLVGGGLTCTTSVSAPIGDDDFKIVTYSGSNGSGTQIATSQIRARITGVGKTTCVRTSSGNAQSGPKT